MFNDISKAIGRPLGTKITLPHGTYLSYIFRGLGINLHGDSLTSTTQSISYGALRHADFTKNTTIGMWVHEVVQPEQNDEDIGVDMGNLPPPQLDAPYASSSHAPSEDTAILDAILSLNERFTAFENNVNVRFTTIEDQLARLLAR